MAFVLLDVYPIPAWIEIGGQIAALIIGLFLLVFVLLAVASMMAMAFGTSWMHEKSDLLKRLRPTVEHINRTNSAALRGVPPPADEKAIVRTAAALPASVHRIDSSVQQASGRVAEKVIEVRARMVQARTIAKVFLFPGLTRPKPLLHTEGEMLEFKSPGYRMLMEEEARKEAASGQMLEPALTTSQLKHVHTH